jgi:prepilin-type N-terminal cleavage/methylation domain-containing protein
MPKRGSDDGFTLLETLVALMVLAVATTVFARSVSVASGQMAGADRLTSAGVLGARLVAETDTSAAGEVFEGTDAPSGLKWRRLAERVGEMDGSGDADNIFLITVEIFNPAAHEPMLQLRTAMTGTVQQ